MTAARLPRSLARRAASLAALAALLVLAACARIPVEGPVRAGEEVTSGDEQETLYYPGSPVAGADPSAIVRGFLEAGTGTADNYGVAREFLTPAAAIAWDATGSTIVVDGDPSVEPERDGVVRVTMKATALVDADGRYTENQTPADMTLEYGLEQVGGEWRIASAPPGIVLLKQNFMNIFAPFSLSFLDSTERFLVPEVRWFPSHASAPTRIVQALVRGPSEWLAEGGTTTAFPAGTQLLGPVIPDDSGVAAVNFSTAISSAPTPAYPFMLLQLTQSLASFSQITGVAMLVNGAKIEVQPPPPDQVIANATVDALPLVVRGGRLGYLSGSAMTDLPAASGLQGALGALDADAGAVSTRLEVATFRTPGGVVALPFSGGTPVVLDTREHLLPPSIGAWGFVWTLPKNETSIRVTDPIYAYGTELSIPNLGQTAITGISVARSGTILALALERNGKAAIATFAVLRDPTTGRPTGLGAPSVLEVDARGALDLAWVDETTVALLAADDRGDTEVFIHQLGGTTERYGGVAGGAHIEGSNTRAGLRVSDADGNVYVPRATQWQPSGAKVDFLVAQG